MLDTVPADGHIALEDYTGEPYAIEDVTVSGPYINATLVTSPDGGPLGPVALMQYEFTDGSLQVIAEESLD